MTDAPAKRLFIKTYGCQMNVYDSGRMADVLAPLGYTPVDAAQRSVPNDADLALGTAPHAAARCSGLRKRYGRRNAVEDVSLEVRRGEVVGLLGPNGAGKTTVIKMLLGLVCPDAGEVMLLGRSSADPMPPWGSSPPSRRPWSA